MRKDQLTAVHSDQRHLSRVGLFNPGAITVAQKRMHIFFSGPFNDWCMAWFPFHLLSRPVRSAPINGTVWKRRDFSERAFFPAE
ncbi:hypothetical protein [Paludifilum halophilum]|uniref:Uncharacterized protein n=1 Tax=Paludifilum halophilum TaxID=1642702 RepID=A0A235B5T7_9BACL|nr:hypothetical protein [Paludifilum halophilum]OYD07602.1 hypothetical protein CHM34_08950 [Paludifilum halophilum]